MTEKDIDPLNFHDDDDDDLFGEKEGLQEVTSTQHTSTAREFAQPISNQSHFDSVLQRLKSRGNRKRREIDSDEAQGYCRHLVELMDNAATADMDAARANQPALAKINMLESVATELSKENLSDHFIANGAIRAIARWLAFDQQGNPPPLSLRARMVDVVSGMDLDHDIIANSEIGKCLLGLWRVETDNLLKAKIADVCLKWVSDVIGQQATGRQLRASHHAAELNRRVRATQGEGPTASRFALAPSRIFTQAPTSNVKSDANTAINNRIAKRVRDMRQKQ